MEDFEYVVQKQETQKICFGSGCKRDMSRRGLNPFMRYYVPDDFPHVAPNSYNVLKSFNATRSKPCSGSISKKGYSGVARFALRIQHREDYPSSLNYNISTFPEPVKQAKYPFNMKSKREAVVTNNNPGPGMYTTAKVQGIQFQHSFGGKKRMQLGVKLKCCNFNPDICKMCGKQPFGDYWQRDNEVCLCRPCMTKCLQRKDHKKAELEMFHKVRDCSNIHLHEGTSAKKWIVHPKAALQWMHKEAYLSAYLKD